MVETPARRATEDWVTPTLAVISLRIACYCEDENGDLPMNGLTQGSLSKVNRSSTGARVHRFKAIANYAVTVTSQHGALLAALYPGVPLRRSVF